MLSCHSFGSADCAQAPDALSRAAIAKAIFEYVALQLLRCVIA
jgi:hypothetical protein